ncbi:ribulose-phosphate 3-epimerase [Nanoarchaeota archaeon]
METKVSVSILTLLKEDKKVIEEMIKKIETCADYVHFDVMDGKFVPPKTIGPKEVKLIQTKLPKDVHLMVENPLQYIDEYVYAGSDIITIHVEATVDPRYCLEYIRKKGAKPAISIKPKTPLSAIEPYLDMVDMVLFMSVEPGYPRQKFIPSVLPKIKKLRKMKPYLDIQIDGGINEETVKLAVDAGANIIVSGSFIFDAEDPEKMISTLKKCK